MNRFGPEQAERITLNILERNGRNTLAEQLKDKLKQVTFINFVLWTRNNFLQFPYPLTLDQNTAHKNLSLSENNNMITCTDTEQLYPDHPDRFDVRPQVLCNESVSGCCYWEIDWCGDRGVCISVSYKSISRKRSGDECVFGYNDQSWSLYCSSSRNSFRHKKIRTELPVDSVSSRIGVYVDHSAGTLSFYSVSRNTMRLIHTVQTTFTQPLYPGFTIFKRSSVYLLINQNRL
ncbi:stonustoxin subunit alpha-like [Cyprinus carpio]|uniref:Stonustoxin subunit alpha-like n=1 Tax=Cyprinus carpio TaxID=7962 RepID=A0A9Q9V5C7_CYPCA|nr:stonustoxin subunit alpha-like [Cyprinus carpio]